MKPVRLEFRGLHSYREPQVVDFESLGAAGLFGVFGPTGSGKSTILDAITLALFGHVERAERGTRGIINQLESSLQVSFEFELGGERYLVERRYDREPGDPESARVRSARLRRLPGREAGAGARGGGRAEDQIVIASGPRETSAAVIALLGLRRDEFSRAVVLPQGKFDEFLKLTGGERARMLEHIFNLERFGDALATRARDLFNRCEMRVREIEGEQRGLGDCSGAAVAEAEEAVREHSAMLDDLEGRHREVETRHRDASGLRALYVEKYAAEARMRELDARSAEFALLRETLAAAVRAAPIRPLIEQDRRISDQIREDGRALQDETARVDAARAAAEKAAGQRAEAEKRLEDGVPELSRRQAVVLEAVRKDSRVRGLVEERSRLAARVKAQSEHAARLRADAANLAAAAQSAASEYAALLAEQERLSIDPNERRLVDLACRALDALEQQEGLLREAATEAEAREREIAGAWAGVVALTGEMAPGRPVESASGVRAVAAEQVDLVERRLREARAALDDARVRAQAPLMAAGLVDGQPCPVCGSTEHPAPARPVEGGVAGGLDAFTSAVRECERRREAVGDWRDRVLSALARWENGARERDRCRMLLEQRRQAVSRAAAAFDGVRGGRDRAAVRARQREMATLDKALFALQDRIRNAHDRRAGAESRRQGLDSELRTLETAVATGEKQIEGIDDQVQALRAEVDAVTGGREPTVVAREIEGELEALRRTAAQTRTLHEDVRSRVERFETSVVALRARLEANSQSLDRVRAALLDALEKAGFTGVDQAEAAMLAESEQDELERHMKEYDDQRRVIGVNLSRLEKAIAGRAFDEAGFSALEDTLNALAGSLSRAREDLAVARDRLASLNEKHSAWQRLEEEATRFRRRMDLAGTLARLLQGRKFVQFIAEEHLRDMAAEASQRLGRLTAQRYALELSDGCGFTIRDDFNGGLRRPVSTLSGGETFLISLALALALSSKIQLRGRYSLGFFFLDEGFGTLDEEKLELVVSALENLHDRDRMVGVISHVRELRDRLPRYLEVVPATGDGGGSQVRMRQN
ncbi:MAG: SMC family ATPase [Firmicutes bacterium]|nr:SMC family ATPase [Bacillota bacterium]